MNKIFRSNGKTKDIAGVIVSVLEIPDEDGKFQLFYDDAGLNPIPKDEALEYIVSGKACSAYELDDDGNMSSFINVSGLCKVTLDESIPNGYYVTLMNGEGSSSTPTGSLYYYGYENFNVDTEGVITRTGSGICNPTPFDLIKNGSVIDEPDTYANYYITASVTTPYGSDGETIKFVATLMFSSAWKIVDPNNGSTRGIMSFVGHLDGGDSSGGESLTVRYEITIDDNGETDEVKLIMPR